jgi:hypothetical protein
MDDATKILIADCIDGMLECEKRCMLKEDYERLLYRIAFAAGYFSEKDRDMKRLLHAILKGKRLTDG